MSISTQFIDQLFNHQYFKLSLKNFNQFGSQLSTQEQQKTINFQIQSVIDDITQILYENFKIQLEKQCNHFYESNRMILEQIQNIKNKLHTSNKLKTQSSTAQRDTKSNKLQTSIFFQGDQQYDMKQIRKNIEDFQDDVENKVLINSFQLQDQQKTYLDAEIEEKINASIEGNITRIQLSLQQKFQKYSEKLEQRIQQLKKTITSVVEAMNDPQYWNKQRNSNSKNKNLKISLTAFSKKQKIIQQKQIEKQNIQENVQKDEPIETIKVQILQVKNPEQKTTHSSNKTIDTLNKSINIGRSKIKSLFGFKSSNQKSKNKQQLVE